MIYLLNRSKEFFYTLPNPHKRNGLVLIRRKMWNLKGGVATNWHVDLRCDFSIARDTKLDWSQ